MSETACRVCGGVDGKHDDAAHEAYFPPSPTPFVEASDLPVDKGGLDREPAPVGEPFEKVVHEVRRLTVKQDVGGPYPIYDEATLVLMNDGTVRWTEPVEPNAPLRTFTIDALGTHCAACQHRTGSHRPLAGGIVTCRECDCRTRHP